MTPDSSANIAISAERLGRYISELGTFGRTPDGGVTRLVYSQPWLEARKQVAVWMEEIGLAVRSDAVGNLFGRLEGTEPGVVLTGSHVDTVPNGGLLDGALGIHAGLMAVGELARTLGRPRRSIEVVATCEEESSRFPSDYWASRAMIGAIGPRETDTMVDGDGISIGSAMKMVGLEPSDIASARRSDVTAFVELHIEQGRILYDENVSAGIVSAIAGQHRIRVTVSGRADHAGTTPMDLRRDAYLGAAEMALAIASIAEETGRPAVATVGRIQVAPGAMNVVPGQATFTIDARHTVASTLTTMVDRIHGTCVEIARGRQLEVAWLPLMEVAPQPLNEGLHRLLEQCADDLGISWKPMVSGAGHDSQVVARAFPTVMIFVPSVEGRSHSPLESTPIEQIVPGVRLLAEAIRRLAY